MYEERIKICKQCRLFDNYICNSKLYLNPSTNETSKKDKPFFYRGCGCLLTIKAKNEYAICPCGKW